MVASIGPALAQNWLQMLAEHWSNTDCQYWLNIGLALTNIGLALAKHWPSID